MTASANSVLRCGTLAVYVASKNRVKIGAVDDALRQLRTVHPAVPVTGIAVPSGVPEQPIGNEQTLLGARTRVHNLRKKVDHGLCVAIEGGIGPAVCGRGLECFAWAVVLDSHSGRVGHARSASFPLPDKVAHLIYQGVELGDADDQVFLRKKSGHGSGTVGHLTHGIISRRAYYEHTVTMALIPFIWPDLYPVDMETL